MRARWVPIALSVAVAAGVLLTQASAWLGAEDGAAIDTDGRTGRPAVGTLAPELEVVTVDGRTISLVDLHGRPVWLTFGASWCQECRAENPDIESAFLGATDGGGGGSSDDLVVLAVFISEDGSTVADYATRVGLTYDKVADPDRRLAASYRVTGLQTHVFIDRSGVIQVIRVGSLDRSGIQAELAKIVR